MAFDRLDPNRDLILRLQAEGRTLVDIAETLSQKKGIETTPATVSRFLKRIGSPQHARELSASEADELDAAAVLAEVMAEMRGRFDEQRAAIEGLAAKVAGLSADIAELEKRSAANATMQKGGRDPSWGRLIAAGSIAASAVLWLLVRA